MKRFLFFTTAFISCFNCFSQPGNTDIATFEKMDAAKFYFIKDLSLASDNFTVHYYRCNWNIDPALRYISGSVTSYFTITASADQITYDLTNKLFVDSIIFHAEKISYSQTTSNTLVINFPFPLSQDANDSLSIFYHGVPDDDSVFKGSFVQSVHDNIPVLWTLSEPYGAAAWWPCRNGLDDKADSIDIYITHPAQYRASSNGVLTDSIKNGNNITTHYNHRYPIASYLVAIAVTNYSVFTTSVSANNISIPVIQYVYPESLQDFESRTYLFLNALKLFSSNFGTYPFYKERYGQTQFGYGGGMEHQTNSFVSGTSENLMVHELAHQWFGDKVTCGSWQDIWLHEGFATWMADLFYTEKLDTAYYVPYVNYDLNKIIAAPGGSVWVDDTTNVDRIFDSRLSYSKGAFLLRMLRWTIGDSAFFKGLNGYLDDPQLAFGFARTTDLQHHLEQTSGIDLNYFFNQWFYGQGFPIFSVQWYQEFSTGKLYVQVDETTSDPSSINFFNVKLPLQLVYNNSGKTITVNCDYNHKQFVLPNPGFTITKIVVDSDKYLISANDTAFENQNAFATLLEQSQHVITVIPNPVKDVANIVLNNISGNTTLQLFSMKGALLFTQQLNITATPLSLQIPFTHLADATYILVVTEDNGTKHHVTIVK
jgi:aminopeptidase N